VQRTAFRRLSAWPQSQRLPGRYDFILLAEQDAHAFLLVRVADDLKDLGHDLRRQAHRGLVEQQHRGLGHHRSANGGHLPLAVRRSFRRGK